MNINLDKPIAADISNRAIALAVGGHYATVNDAIKAILAERESKPVRSAIIGGCFGPPKLASESWHEYNERCKRDHR